VGDEAMTAIPVHGEITKEDLKTAVFLSQGEVDRYRIMLEHDIRAYELMNPELAEAPTVQLPWRGMFDFGDGREFRTYPSWMFTGPVSDADDAGDVITHVDGIGRDTDETGHVYERPEV
jgi:hypothetical protein